LGFPVLALVGLDVENLDDFSFIKHHVTELKAPQDTHYAK
jgi:hypothetical protein